MKSKLVARDPTSIRVVVLDAGEEAFAALTKFVNAAARAAGPRNRVGRSRCELIDAAGDLTWLEQKAAGKCDKMRGIRWFGAIVMSDPFALGAQAWEKGFGT